MQTIEVNKKTITFDLGEELRAKDLAKVQKIQNRATPWEEIEMMFWFVREFCSKDDLETVENMNVADFTEFSEQIAKLIDFSWKLSEAEEKKKESSSSTVEK